MSATDDWRKYALDEILPIEDFKEALSSPTFMKRFSEFVLSNMTNANSFDGPTIVMQPLGKNTCIVAQWNQIGDEVTVFESPMASTTVFQIHTSQPFALGELYGTSGFSSMFLKALGKDRTTLYFSSYAAATVYHMYFRLSIMRMPNAHPSDHWKWVLDSDIVVDPSHKEGYIGPTHSIYYGFSNEIMENRSWDSDLRQFAWFGSILDMIGEKVNIALVSREFVHELWDKKDILKDLSDIEKFTTRSFMDERILNELVELISSNEVKICWYDEACKSAQTTVNYLLA